MAEEHASRLRHLGHHLAVNLPTPRTSLLDPMRTASPQLLPPEQISPATGNMGGLQCSPGFLDGCLSSGRNRSHPARDSIYHLFQHNPIHRRGITRKLQDSRYSILVENLLPSTVAPGR